MSAWDFEARRELLTPEFASSLPASSSPETSYEQAWRDSSAATAVDRLLDVDLHTYLPGDLLVKVDVATMAHSLEARSPFLDHQLMEWAARLPSRLKLEGTDQKRVLKAALRGRLPDAVLDRPKMGFGIPLSEWFRGELRDLPAERLLDPSALGRGWLRRDVVERTIAEHRSGEEDHGLRLWVLIQLESWARETLDARAGRVAPS